MVTNKLKISILKVFAKKYLKIIFIIFFRIYLSIFNLGTNPVLFFKEN